MESDPGFQVALSEARAGLAEGGIPIGGCLVGADGTILGQGRNMRMQNGSPTLHVSSNLDGSWVAMMLPLDLLIRIRSSN
jgi:tRNA(Arg) A34 adenosine deaminase TadA